jgi:hypothetical protein
MTVVLLQGEDLVALPALGQLSGPLLLAVGPSIGPPLGEEVVKVGVALSGSYGIFS